MQAVREVLVLLFGWDEDWSFTRLYLVPTA
jgi:hypothetical protein